MTVTPNEYEVLVKGLVQKIASSKNINIVEPPRFGTTNKIAGESGYHHQIDVSVMYRSKDDLHRLKLIECKLYSGRKICIGDVLTFHARIYDIQQKVGDSILVEGNLYTTIGYTKPAKKYADFYKIATNSLSTDSEAYSVSFADDVVIGLRTANVNLIPQPAKISGSN